MMATIKKAGIVQGQKTKACIKLLFNKSTLTQMNIANGICPGQTNFPGQMTYAICLIKSDKTYVSMLTIIILIRHVKFTCWTRIVLVWLISHYDIDYHNAAFVKLTVAIRYNLEKAKPTMWWVSLMNDSYSCSFISYCASRASISAMRRRFFSFDFRDAAAFFAL